MPNYGKENNSFKVNVPAKDAHQTSLNIFQDGVTVGVSLIEEGWESADIFIVFNYPKDQVDKGKDRS